MQTHLRLVRPLPQIDERKFHVPICPHCQDSELVVASDGEEECPACGWSTADDECYIREDVLSGREQVVQRFSRGVLVAKDGQ